MKKLTAGQKIMVADGFPVALILSQEERREAWDKFIAAGGGLSTPAAPKPRRSPEEEAEIAKFTEELEEKKRIAEKAKAQKRAALQKNKFIPGATWDVKYSRWVHPTLERERAEKTGEAFKIAVVDRQPRAAGTKAAAKYAEMVKYLDANPSASLADVLRDTAYQKVDFDWDLSRGSVKKVPIE